MSWQENEKFVLEKLEALEDDLEDAENSRKESHGELSGKMDEFKDELKQLIKEQDVTTDVTELRTRQRIIGAALVLLACAVVWLHFGIPVPL